jgi:NADH:ubiquinone oxidoreductase subunit B-like Fe-S oxidoreductase
MDDDMCIQPANAFAYQILLLQKKVQEREDAKKEHNTDYIY